MESGIQECDTFCSVAQNGGCETEDLFLTDLCMEFTPQLCILGQNLAAIINVENSFLNIIEEVCQFGEKSFFQSKFLTKWNSSSTTQRKKFKIPNLRKLSPIEVHKLLQIDEHIERICRTHECISDIRDFLHSDKLSDVDINAFDSIYDRLQNLLALFETAVVNLNNTLFNFEHPETKSSKKARLSKNRDDLLLFDFC